MKSSIKMAGILAAVMLGTMIMSPGAFAQEEVVAEVVEEAAAAVSVEMFTVNNTWMLVATFLVFIMHLGFACLEVGLTRAKNTVNILFKNTAIVAIGILTYAAVGFNLMYPGDAYTELLGGGVFGFAGFGLTLPDGPSIEYAGGAYTYWTDFIFQAMFAATAATIISGAVAERIKLLPFLLITTVYVAFVYPMLGGWIWGGGFLGDTVHDFAGSTIVHSVGGWGALAGVIILGPRLGKYVGGKTKGIAGHSMPLATIGVFLLWLGWFGFNGGSVLSADADGVSYVFVTTTLAAASGVIGAMITTWIVQKKPDLSMILNGSLAGLVGITAGADVVGVMDSIVIGAVAGILVVFAVLGFDKLKLDDPVGALSVHLVCGIWGTLAVGIFSPDWSVIDQAKGVFFYGLVAFPAALILFTIAKFTLGIRVSEKEEIGGLDVGEHGMEAYSGFQIFTVD